MAWPLFIFLFSCLLSASAQQQCGRDVGGRLCPNGLCCSRWGYCGTTPDHCGDGCQSQCTLTPPPPPPPPALAAPPPPPGGGGGDLSTLIPRSTFEEMLKHRGSDNCKGSFYTYEAFIAAAKHFPDFAAVGDEEIRKREIAAFFGQTSHETRGGWETAPDGPFAWGYCWVEEREKNDYCDPSSIEWPCVPGKQYYGRGPIQLSWNYNYGQAGVALQYHLLPNPDLVATDPTVSFEAALWFWMTPQPPKPSCHDVITGIWHPSPSDIAAHRLPGYGVITNIINGGLECGIGVDARVESRIGFYKRYCDIYGLEYGDNLDCNHQRHFGWGLSSSAI